MGNGNESSGDGFRFRGRGYFYLTGKDNYERMSKDTGINLVETPELVGDPNVGLLVAAAYWYRLNLNAIADEGSVSDLTKHITGGKLGIKGRIEYTNLAIAAFEKK